MKKATVTIAAVLATLTAGTYLAVSTNVKMTRQPQGVVQVNGRLEVERLEIASKFAGQVVEVAVQEGQRVKAGDVIARMDAADLEAQLQGVQAMDQRASQAYKRAQGESQVRNQYLRVAQLELKNTVKMHDEDLVSNAELERRQAQRDGEAAGVSVARAAMGEASAAKAEAQAGMKRLRQAIGDHTLRAPMDGRIEYRVVEPGAVIPAGGRVATLLNTSQVYMTVFLPTAQAGRLQIGDEARLVLDAAPGIVIPARVSFVAEEAQFTPKYVETATEREKLMYRVKLKVEPQLTHQYAAYVKAGMTGNGYVRIKRDTAWPDKLAVNLPKN
ncbi:HlyD family secretion protein [Aquabacterium sp. CECT 9606]|uniref:HlyD family secretion protein n=1 Tax=Aquabacterium sp. CECT 9606 TaxID=2845822 RepID=UPI001E37DB18|nr:HlyD family efflux transporter periplasmic adaptor subunit [Aquabacterium sp. CECT 9606]CAH0350940.1 hypothetical protein AQB9606_01844 [Aquabacterium sp. CECT 9606]